jgi:hypothetical protein
MLFRNEFLVSDGGGDYEKSLPLSSLLSLLGHLALIIGLIIKTSTSKAFVVWLGLAFMTASILNVLFHAFDFLAMMTVVGSFPYLFSSILLLKTSIKSFKNEKKLATLGET